MAIYFKKPFALSGTVTAIPTDTTIDGQVSFEQGYTADYELNPSTDPNAKNIERAKMNYLFNQITGNIKQWQEQTFPNWIDDKGDGLPFAYPRNALVKYTDGNTYVSKIDNNTEEPTTGSNWQEFTAYLQSFGAEIATAEEIRIGTDNTKTISPLGYNATTLGWGQTWQDVTASRALGVTYTNSTGKPIFVNVTNTSPQGIPGIIITATVSGVVISSSGGYSASSNEYHELGFIVPNGQTYSITGGASITLYKWAELR